LGGAGGSGPAEMTKAVAMQARDEAAPVAAQVAPPAKSEAATASAGADHQVIANADRQVIANTDRQVIASLVARALAARGLARGSEASPRLRGEAEIAAEVVAKRMGAAPKSRSEQTAALVGPPEKADSSPPVATPGAPGNDAMEKKVPIRVAEFVSENDIRQAMRRSEKIFIGPKTIVTPSARDLGSEHGVFVDTQ